MELNLSHHAYLLIGSDHVRANLVSILEKTHKIVVRANPDFFDRSYQIFTIDDAREVKTFHGTRPVHSDGKKIFVLVMNGATVEAQNALLKLLEEPAEYAHFFIIISSAHLLLPTVKSRMQIIEMKQETGSRKQGGGKNEKNAIGKNKTSDTINSELLQSAKKFVTSSKAKRLEEVKKLIDDISKEKKTKQDAIDLLNAIQVVVYEEKGVKGGKSALEVIETARTYIDDRAPSVKMLLEYVALNV
jgi:DNA polymerase III delta prime subunit